MDKFWEGKWKLVTVVLSHSKTRFASSQSLVPTEVVLVTSNPRFATTKPSSATNLRVQDDTLIFAAVVTSSHLCCCCLWQQWISTKNTYFVKSNRWTGSGALTLLPPYLTANIASESISKSNATPINEIDIFVSLRTDLISVCTLTFLFWLEGTIKQGNMTSEGIDISPLTLQSIIEQLRHSRHVEAGQLYSRHLALFHTKHRKGFEASSRDTSLLSQLETLSCRWSTMKDDSGGCRCGSLTSNATTSSVWPKNGVIAKAVPARQGHPPNEPSDTRSPYQVTPLPN